MASLKHPLVHTPPARTGHPLDAWRRAAAHPVMGIYLRLPRQTLPPRLARWTVAFVWVFWLGGTALAVRLYPQAAERICTEIYSMTYCHPALSGEASPLFWVDLWLARLLSVALLAIPPLLLAGSFLRTLVGGLRGQPSRPSNRLTLATAWQTGLVEMLHLTPLPSATLIRIRVLSRLVTAWRQRAWLVLGLGLLGAISVSHAVVVPPYPWLGSWGNWLSQVGLVALWGLVLAGWAVALSVFAVLNEVTHNSQSIFPGLSWATLAGIQFVIMIVSPGYILLRLWTQWRMLGGEAPAWWTLAAPLVVAVMGLVMAGVNYVAAQIVFYLRLRHRTQTPH